MTTFHYIMSPLEKSFFLHPSNAVRMWGIKRVFVARVWGEAVGETFIPWPELVHRAESTTGRREALRGTTWLALVRGTPLDLFLALNPKNKPGKKPRMALGNNSSICTAIRVLVHFPIVRRFAVGMRMMAR